MEEPTGPMRSEAASSGFYASPWRKEPYPRLQILTVKELLEGKKVDMPQTGDLRTFKKAAKAAPRRGDSGDLLHSIVEPDAGASASNAENDAAKQDGETEG